jgi:hypothetical protein
MEATPSISDILILQAQFCWLVVKILVPTIIGSVMLVLLTYPKVASVTKVIAGKK